MKHEVGRSSNLFTNVQRTHWYQKQYFHNSKFPSSFIMASNFGDLYSMAMVQTGFNLNLTHQIDANMIIKPINFYAFGR